MPEPDCFSPLSYKRCYTAFNVGENPTLYVLAAAARRSFKMVLWPTAAATRGFTMVVFTASVSRRNTFVGGTCALPSSYCLVIVLPFQKVNKAACNGKLS